MLSVSDIEKTYDEQPLLKGVSFSVEENETVCLLGPSGSGKSTLLRIIAGLEEPEGGDVRWDNASLAGVPTHQRRFGLMFQDYALFPHRNVAENIAFGLKMQNLPADEIRLRVENALQTIGMTGFSKRKVTELSGGEQQRVALARALAPNPRMLMLDEPLGALDRALRATLSQELRHILHDSKIPAIYVTHDQEEAFAIADRLLLLHQGSILQSGRPHEFFHRPCNAWVARFFGLGNLIGGTVTSQVPLQVETPLGMIHASCQNQVPALGQHTTLLFRPSQARQAPTLSENKVTGKVLDQVFQGEKFLVSLFINEQVPLFNIMLPEPVSLGDVLAVNYQPTDVLCLNNGA
ncbi:MAG: ABC transporter ATP-binding protein [Chloroflexi bacterium]|jgi:ABC-type Fe3+/spermidine/putrescine transport system ATPase subunit|nr:ABC transporter ATP-binding protein [Chloroflexota bacterium]